MEPAEELASSLSGEHIAKMLRSDGPIVSCVLLKSKSNAQDNGNDNDAPASDAKPSAAAKDEKDAPRVVLANLISEVKIDTTPKKQMVAQTLGGPFTFLGQYEDEGIVVMVRRPEDIENDDDSDAVPNPHSLQPPLHNAEVLGDILLMRVAAVEEDEQKENDEKGDGDGDAASSTDAEAKSSDTNETDESKDSQGESVAGRIVPNEEFFLDYTKEEYIKFASRTDIVATEPPEEGDESEVDLSEDDDEEDDDFDVESDDEDDMDDEECQIGMMNLILAQILKRFREENGRGPNTEELLAMRSALAEKLGIDESLVNESVHVGSAEEQLNESEKRKIDDSKDSAHKQKRVKFNNKDEIKIMTDDEEATSELKDEEEKSALPVA